MRRIIGALLLALGAALLAGCQPGTSAADEQPTQQDLVKEYCDRQCGNLELAIETTKTCPTDSVPPLSSCDEPYASQIEKVLSDAQDDLIKAVEEHRMNKNDADLIALKLQSAMLSSCSLESIQTVLDEVHARM